MKLRANVVFVDWIKKENKLRYSYINPNAKRSNKWQ